MRLVHTENDVITIFGLLHGINDNIGGCNGEEKQGL